MPSSGDPFGPGSPLQSPLRSDFRFYPYRLACRRPRPGSQSRNRPGGPRQWLTNTTPPDVMDHCPTRARCANPQGVLLSATLRSGPGSQGYGAKAPRRAEKRDRGSALPAVACAPAPLAPLAAPGLAATVALLRARGPNQPSRPETDSAQRTITVLYTQSIRRAS